MKRIVGVCLTALLLLTSVACLSGCGEEPTWEVTDAEGIDTSLYAPSRVCGNMERTGFVDAPGMLLYYAQEVQTANGSISGTAFINKATGASHLFCFDPLCEHDSASCIARAFPLREGMMAYNAVSDMLYCILPSVEFGDGGDTVYRIDMTASAAVPVMKGDRNEVRSITASGKYVFWTHELPKGGRELCRLDVQTETVDTYRPPEGKSVLSFHISGEHLYLLLQDEIEYYLTDLEFSDARKLEHFHTGIGWEYLCGKTAYLAVREEEAYQNSYLTAFMAYDVETGEQTALMEGEPFLVSGLSEEYVYYHTRSDAMQLWRRRLDGSGKSEALYRIDPAILGGTVSGGTPYFHTVLPCNEILVGQVRCRTDKGLADRYLLLVRDNAGRFAAKRIDAYA